MKDEHNVILIIVSSKWLIPYSGGSSNSWFQLFIFSFSRSSNLFQLFHHGDSSKSVQWFTLCFQPLFPSVWSSFCYRSSSGRLYMVVHQGFNSFSKCSSIFFSEELKYSLSCILKCNSFNHIIWGGAMSFFIIWVHVSWFHMLSRMRYLKSINLFIEVILGYISPKAFPDDICYLWCL